MAKPTIPAPDEGADSPALEAAARRLAEAEALAVVLVDAHPLRAIERGYGYPAYRQALRRLQRLVSDALESGLPGELGAACGETSSGEVVWFLPRPPQEAGFYLKTLPRLAEHLQRRLAREGSRVAYPYMRTVAPLFVGSAFVLRNPRLGAITQVRSAVAEARADADLNTRCARRERRRRLLDLILSEHIVAVFEPIVDARNLTVFGYEALARGPEGSDLASPARLFATAEEEDLLFELDCLCRRKALEGAIDFPTGTKLFLNIRPVAIHDPSFQPDALKRTLQGCGLSPSDVVFEISEQESISNYEIFRETRDEYGKLGFQFALDDTGAGYASMEALIELGPRFIKVDRAFITGIDEDPIRQTVLRAFRAVADHMGARIVGEGLDTLEELHTLGEMGIDFGQGWLFGKPHPLRGKS